MKSMRSLIIVGICVLSVVVTASDATYAVEFSMVNTTGREVDVYVDGAKRCSLAPSGGSRQDYCSLEVSRDRHRIDVIRSDGWQQSVVHDITDETRCVIESEVSCCCKAIEDLEDFL